MGIASFIPSIWEQALITKFRGISVTNLITTAPTRVEGGKAIFNIVSGGTIKDYTGADITYDGADTAPLELVYDQKKYFALKLDDVDKVQAAGEVLNTLAAEKALDMKEIIDTAVLSAIAGKAPAANTIGAVATKVNLVTTKAYDVVVDLGTKLSKKKVPISGRFVLASAEYINEMAKDQRFTQNFNVLPNGIVQGATINGMQVIQCEEVPANTILAVHKSAFGFGSQLDEVEALRLQTAFADAVRGLQVYGLKELRVDAIAKAFVEFKTV